VDVYDPWASPSEVEEEFGFKSLGEIPNKKYHTVVLTVAHKEFMNLDLRSYLVDSGVLYDVKGVLDTNEIDARL
jgi:UDP-N-acetyl-D-galactosamine dehydrogenase